jgi:hypothetical protein
MPYPTRQILSVWGACPARRDLYNPLTAFPPAVEMNELPERTAPLGFPFSWGRSGAIKVAPRAIRTPWVA